MIPATIDLDDGMKLMPISWSYLDGTTVVTIFPDGYGLYEEIDGERWKRVDQEVYSVS